METLEFVYYLNLFVFTWAVLFNIATKKDLREPYRTFNDYWMLVTIASIIIRVIIASAS